MIRLKTEMLVARQWLEDTLYKYFLSKGRRWNSVLNCLGPFPVGLGRFIRDGGIEINGIGKENVK
jgi:hypothetical protein